jgi:hypothetical protein
MILSVSSKKGVLLRSLGINLDEATSGQDKSTVKINGLWMLRVIEYHKKAVFSRKKIFMKEGVVVFH